MYGDFHEFCRLRNLLTKGASQRNLKEWYLKGQMRTASVSPGNSTDELDKSFSSPSRRKQQRVSVEVNPVRNRIPYYYPEQVPGKRATSMYSTSTFPNTLPISLQSSIFNNIFTGPGAYNVTSTLLRTTHNRKADFVPQNQPRPSSRKEFSKPISLEEFERTNKISGVLSFTEVGNGTYLNHKKQYRTRSAPSGGRPPAAVPVCPPFPLSRLPPFYIYSSIHDRCMIC